MQRVSPRERQILFLVAQGHQSKEIATRLGICKQTVNAHVWSAMTKLSARSRSHAVYLLASAGDLAGAGESA